MTTVSIAFSFSLYHSARNTRESAQQLQQLEAAIRETEREVAALEEATKEAEKPFVKEKIIRNELLMQKPGEYVVQIPEVLEQTANIATPTPEPLPWEEWKTLLLTKH